MKTMKLTLLVVFNLLNAGLLLNRIWWGVQEVKSVTIVKKSYGRTVYKEYFAIFVIRILQCV